MNNLSILDKKYEFVIFFVLIFDRYTLIMNIIWFLLLIGFIYLFYKWVTIDDEGNSSKNRMNNVIIDSAYKEVIDFINESRHKLVEHSESYGDYGKDITNPILVSSKDQIIFYLNNLYDEESGENVNFSQHAVVFSEHFGEELIVFKRETKIGIADVLYFLPNVENADQSSPEGYYLSKFQSKSS